MNYKKQSRRTVFTILLQFCIYKIFVIMYVGQGIAPAGFRV